MGTDKAGTKGGGFFHIFDWNKKSRKKLFSSGVSPEATKQARRSDDNFPTTRFVLNEDEDDYRGVSSIKGSSDYSCASSVTDDDINGTRAPGVVARLMGLDSLPTTSASEPYATPYFDRRQLRGDARYQKRSPEYNLSSSGGQFAGSASSTAASAASASTSTAEIYLRKPPDMKRQKMPSSPIEKFQTEMLPPRTAKSLPLTHHKLLSPIKNSRFISSDNAAHIMEAAAKILNPGHQMHSQIPSSNTRVRPIGPPSVPLMMRDPQPHDCLGGSFQRTPRFRESTNKKPAESNAVKCLKGQSLTKSWNGSECETISYKASPVWSEEGSLGSRNKGKSVSLAIQAKVNVQKREGINSGQQNSFVQLDQRDVKSKQSLVKDDSNAQRNRLHRKVSQASASGVLKQNNLKQNCLANKDKLPSRPAAPSQQNRKAASGGAVASARNKSSNKLPSTSKGGMSNKTGHSSSSEKESTSRQMDYPRKKRLIEAQYNSEKSEMIDDILASRHEKYIQPNVIIDEHLKRANDSMKSGMDVVSFTFTSPIAKTQPIPQSSTKFLQKQDERFTSVDECTMRKWEDGKKTTSTIGMNVISGDALGILLEQKLRELTLGLGSSQKEDSAPNDSCSTSKDVLYSFESSGACEMDSATFSCEQDKAAPFYYSGSSLCDSHRLQEPESSTKYDGNGIIFKDCDNQQPSPFSVLEACFPNESGNSSDSCENSSIGSRISSSYVAQQSTSVHDMMDAEIEVSDSATSLYTGHANDDAEKMNVVTHSKAFNELSYVQEILVCAASGFSDPVSGYAINTLDPNLFDLMERRCSLPVSYKDNRLSRKLLFDCVHESFDLKTRHFFSAGYQSWTRGAALVQSGGLPREICKEISAWRTMGDWMVDDLVENDMSTTVGRWIDFETEAFESGIEIGRKILSGLIDEMVAELLV